MDQQLHILCVSRYFKGVDYIATAAREGHLVYLLTSSKLKEEEWPWEALADCYYMEEDADGTWNQQHLLDGLAFVMRKIKFDVFTALDDFDVEHVAMLRAYFHIPGMGESTARYFRDKLAMRMKAHESGIPVPEFTSLFNDDDIQKFAENVSLPWLIKPRMQASATGIRKIYDVDSLWSVIHKLGEKRHEYLLERFAPGQVYHADALCFKGKVVFCSISGYLDTPFDVAHGGGIFRSVTLDPNQEEYLPIKILNEQILSAFGLQYSAAHTEFIKSSEDGSIYFLETASRVGGAHIAEMVEAATGVNLWSYWAKLEICERLHTSFSTEESPPSHAGIIISLCKDEYPDTSSFDDPEICWRLLKKHHIGFIVKSHNRARVLELLDKYSLRIKEDFHASLPAPDKPSN